jgi:hypothetical protein
MADPRWRGPLLALSIAAAAGCGSSGGAVPPPTTNAPTTTSSLPDALSSDDYRAEISSICVATDAEVEAAVTSALSAGAPDATVARRLLLDTVIPKVDGEIASVAALDGPADLESAVQRMLETARSELDGVRTAAMGDDPLSVFASDPFPQTHSMAAELGIDGCKYVAEG